METYNVRPFCYFSLQRQEQDTTEEVVETDIGVTLCPFTFLSGPRATSEGPLTFLNTRTDTTDRRTLSPRGGPERSKDSVVVRTLRGWVRVDVPALRSRGVQILLDSLTTDEDVAVVIIQFY